MKTRLASVLVLATALSALLSASLVAAPGSDPARAVSVRAVDNNGWEVSRGTSARTLVNRFGAPDARLSDSIWIYRHFHSVPNQAQTRECDTLVVTLSGGAVVNLHLVNERAVAVIIAQLQNHAEAPAMVALGE